MMYVFPCNRLFSVRCCRALAVVSLLLVFIPLLAWPNAGVAADLRIGVLAYDGKQQALARWQPTADYLSAAIPSHHFLVKPLTHEEFAHALNKHELSFVLTNPGHYVPLEVKHGVTRVATFLNAAAGKVLMRFSSVVFTAADSGITSLEQLPGHRFAAVSEKAFGGYQLAADALMVRNIDARQSLDIRWLGFPHADVVRAVLRGEADAGTVRSGVLEAMVASGEISLSDVRVLSPRKHADFPLLHSVDLYPEWPFAKTASTDAEMARQVALALLAMPANAPAAIHAGGAGWTIPLNYSAVHDVLRRLQLEPFPPKSLTMARLWSEYRGRVVVVLALLLLSILLVAQVLSSNRRLRHAQLTLQRHQGELEQTVRQRTEDLEQSNGALKREIASHVAAEQTMQQGCDALQGLSAIFMRDDLDREQRLMSVMDAVRQYLGTELGLLSRRENGQWQPCCLSPDVQKTGAPLSASLAEEAVGERHVVSHEHSNGWRRYMACPVFLNGELQCLLEFATPETASGASPVEGRLAMPSDAELSVKILGLVAQWMGYERSLLEAESARQQSEEALLQRFSTLTRREKDVLGLLVQGESTKGIARALNISPKTVEMHRSNLLRKTAAKSSTELVQLAVSSGILR